jgi:hypothetical protein
MIWHLLLLKEPPEHAKALPLGPAIVQPKKQPTTTTIVPLTTPSTSTTHFLLSKSSRYANYGPILRLKPCVPPNASNGTAKTENAVLSAKTLSHRHELHR